MHIGSVLLVIWLVIGAIAAGQRGYYSGPVSSCTAGGTIAVTILAGPAQLPGRQPEGQLHTPAAQQVAGRRAAGPCRRRETPSLWWTDGVGQAVPSHLRLRST